MKPKYLGDIQNVGYFHGTWDELDTIIERSRTDGEWSKIGATDVFTLSSLFGNEPQHRIYWWRDTGDFLYQSHNVLSGHMSVDRWDRLAWKVKLEEVGLTSGESPEAASGATQRLSIAEKFIRDPFELFGDFFSEKKFTAKKGKEVKKLVAKAANIKIPKEDPSAWEVAHLWRPKRKYLGFSVRPRGSFPERFRGTVIVDYHIDLSLPFRMASSLDPNPMGEAMRSFMRDYDKLDNRAWDARRCEQFFEDYNNFI
jgi:hypothetical protein